MNKTLTFISNMFTNLDITDMETCYKLFRREAIQAIAPTLKEERFGFEPEVTAKVARSGMKVYECAISYNPRSYEEGKKIGWKDGVRALYCILHYGADTAPLPMQLLIYLFIGFTSLVVNQAGFFALLASGLPLHLAIVAAYALSAICNYLMCIVILFRHKARWDTGGEIFLYLLSVMFMCGVDYAMTTGLLGLSLGPGQAKFWASIAGFIGNFLLRRHLVFPSNKPAGDGQGAFGQGSRQQGLGYMVTRPRE
jgi:putative flippase GtrA